LHLRRIADCSTNSQPHIFADSYSGEESNERKMFLSYSSQDVRSRNLLESGSSSRRVVERRSSRNSNCTPHLFLPYAGRETSNEFEKRCISLMRDEPLSEMQASSIAKAMHMASVETAKGQRAGTKLRHSLHASIFKKVLRRQNDTLVEVEDDDTPDLLSIPDQSSTWEIDFLKDQMKRQQDELEFLRAAMRHLISSMEDIDDLGDEQPVQPMHRRPEKESRNPMNVGQPLGIQDRDLLEKLPMVHAPAVQGQEIMNLFPSSSGRFPSVIEIPMDFDGSDDQSEQMSELQSPSVIVLGNLAEKMKALRKDMPSAEITPAPMPGVSALALQNKFTVLRKSAEKPSYQITASIIDISNDEECKEENMEETMQLVMTTTSAKENQRKYTYTDMVRGEVQEGRARGVKHQLHFAKKGVYVEGLYSGTMRDGLPQGSGVLRFTNRDLYIGEFSKGRMHGEGSLLSRSHRGLSTFRGIFKNNEFVEPVATAKPVSANELEIEL